MRTWRWKVGTGCVGAGSSCVQELTGGACHIDFFVRGYDLSWNVPFEGTEGNATGRHPARHPGA